ncbi:ATP-binding protein [Desulforhopalus sp. 52FAK]
MVSISQLLKETRAILNMAVDNNRANHEEKLRMKHYLIFLLCGIALILAFGMYSFIKGNLILYALLFATLCIFLFAWFRLFSSPFPRRIYRLTICTYAILLCYNFTHGGMLDGRSLWLYTFPLIVFFLLGTAEGLIWVIVVPIISIALHFSPFSFVESHHHNPEYLLRYLLVYAMLTAITYWFEHFRSHYRDDLQLEHKRFQEILTYSKDILYRRDLTSNRYDYISDALGNHLDYPVEEYKNYTSTDFENLIHPDDKEDYLQQIQTIADTKSERTAQKSLEFRMRHRNGEYLWFRDQIAFLYNENDEPETIIGSNREVTELRLVEEALREAKQQLLTILDAFGGHIYVSDMKTHEILFINKQMQEDFGADLTGKICFKEFRNREEPCEDCSNYMLLDQNNNSTGVHDWEGYNTITNRWYLNHDRAIQWVDGRWVRIQIAEDITRQKYLEEERKHNEEIVSRAKQLETISTLISGISHDFNNLLQTILGNIAIVEDSGSDNDLKQSSLAELKEAARRATELITRMLTISSAQPKYCLPMPIVPFLEQVLIECTERLPIERECIIQADLKNVLIDYSQIITALKNIIQNACDNITGKGKITINADNFTQQTTSELSRFGTIRQTDGLKDGNYVRIKITDNGQGIDSSDLNKVFEPYFSTKMRDANKGLGLGLTISYAIITQHSGIVQIESEKGIGTTVTLYLPASETEPEYDSA